MSELKGKRYILAWNSILMFTESFYFFAWRLVEVLNRRKSDGYRFPGPEGVAKKKNINTVRNKLLEHPEKRGHFEQSLTITDAGPVLRSSQMIIDGNTGQSFPVDESPDQGLYVAARALSVELETKFARAASKLSELSTQCDPNDITGAAD